MSRAFGLALLLAVLAASADAQSLRRFSDGGKWGYLDSTGAVAIPPRFANAYDTWSEGFARVQLDPVKYAYINARGRVIGAPGFDGAMNFSSGHAAVRVGDKWGVIDTTGAMVIPLGLKESISFYEGRAIVREAGKHGYVDTRGRPVTPMRFTNAHRFFGGWASVEVDKKWGLIDTTGRFVVEPSYERVKALSTNIYAAKFGDTWRLIDRAGRPYGSSFDISGLSEVHEGLAAARQRGKTGYIDTSGTWVIPPTFDAALDFSGGRAAVRRSDWAESGQHWGYIDRTGKVVVRVNTGDGFAEGLAAVTLAEVTREHPLRYGYIDTTGAVVIQPQFWDAAQFSGGMARVEFPDRTWGYIDRTGRTLWRGEPEPEPPSPFAMAPVRTDDTSGLAGSGPLVDRAARLVSRLETAEQRGELEINLFGPPKLLAIIVGADIRVRAHADSHPDDAQLLLLAARLGRLRQVAQPISFRADHPPTLDSLNATFAHNLRYVERAIALQPANADAHYWMGRLYAVRTGWQRFLYGAAATDAATMQFFRTSLDSALYFGRRAVELGKEERYREALMQYLLMAGRHDEALAMARTLAGGHHPVSVLLDDWNRLPTPPAAVLAEKQTNAITEMQSASGIQHAGLRVRVYVVSQPAAQVEAFYRTRWPGLRFFEQKDVETEGEDRMLVQILRFKGQGLEPAKNEEEVRNMDGARAPEGLAMVLLELTSATAEMRVRFEAPSSGTFCILTVMNTRRFK